MPPSDSRGNCGILQQGSAVIVYKMARMLHGMTHPVHPGDRSLSLVLTEQTERIIKAQHFWEMGSAQQKIELLELLGLLIN